MSKFAPNTRVACLVTAVLGLGLVAMGAEPAATSTASKGYDAHTEPNFYSKTNFPIPGVIKEVFVKEGDTVKQGQPLIKLDDEGDLVYLESLRLEGNSDLKIRAAQADLEQKRVELDRKREQMEKGAAPEQEVREAEVAVLIRELQVKVEEMTRRQKSLEADRQAHRVKQMTILAPSDGIVEKIDLKLGETPEQQRFACTIVNNSPLWVNVYLPTAITASMKMGQQLDVKYKDTGEMVKGKVIKLSPRADAASETREIRLELTNPKALPSGLAVTVIAPDTAAAAPNSTAGR